LKQAERNCGVYSRFKSPLQTAVEPLALIGEAAMTLKQRSLQSLAACTLMLSGLTHAAPPTWLPPAELPHGTALLQIEELKAVYLQCDRLSSTTFLDSSTAAHCSMASEQLRRIGFDGRSESVLAWWKMKADERRSAAPASRDTSSKGLASL
jgi:hypothetical protein